MKISLAHRQHPRTLDIFKILVYQKLFLKIFLFYTSPKNHENDLFE